MMGFKSALYILCLALISLKAFAVDTEEARLRGFSEHNSENIRFDKNRINGENEFLEEVEKWERQRARDAIEFKAQKKSKEMTDDGVEAKQDAAEKKKAAREYQASQRKYIIEKSQQEKVSREKNNLPSEAQELGLDSNRPRYTYSKRASFGRKSKFGGASSSSSGAASGIGNNSFPPPPNFDDFSSGGGGYVPAPNLPEDFGDMPPPPPPPMMNPGFGDEGGFSNDYSPPPPPPPPAFGEF